MALALLPTGATAREVVPLGDLHDMLAETYLGDPDNVQLRELHVMDLNGDTHLDAYVVTTFRVSGGAKDAGGVLYLEGRDGGLCDLADEMSVGGSVRVNGFGPFRKWISRSIMPPPGLVPTG